MTRIRRKHIVRFVRFLLRGCGDAGATVGQLLTLSGLREDQVRPALRTLELRRLVQRAGRVHLGHRGQPATRWVRREYLTRVAP